MKIIKSDFEVIIETWDDPGDYPSNAGQFPLPSYDYVGYVEGECVIELDANELKELEEIGLDHADHIRDAAIDEVPSGISVCKWDMTQKGNKVILEIAEFDAHDYQPPEAPEPDYDLMRKERGL